MGVTDLLGRPVRDLRISVTDRCNFRCVYCMPKEVFGHDYRFLPRRELLTFEEIERVARVFVDLGVHKLRITGGEPLLRRDLEVLIGRLAALDDDLDVTMTTNADGGNSVRCIHSAIGSTMISSARGNRSRLANLSRSSTMCSRMKGARAPR